MISKLFEAGIMLICKVCGFQSELGKLEKPHSSFNLCPECMKVTKGSVLIRLEDYQKQELEKKLRRHIYCKECGFIGLLDDFPFNGPREDVCSEKYCPECMSVDDLINASDVTLCTSCRARPAEDNDDWCVGCSADACEAACFAESDFEPWD